MTIDITLENYQLTINYRDNGVGLKPDELDQIFDAFYTTKGDMGGTGLGTHIVKNLVEDTLNGVIDVESQPGQGLYYQIILPDMRYS
jgi:signal transduction histidine kinase